MKQSSASFQQCAAKTHLLLFKAIAEKRYDIIHFNWLHDSLDARCCYKPVSCMFYTREASSLFAATSVFAVLFTFMANTILLFYYDLY